MCVYRQGGFVAKKEYIIRARVTKNFFDKVNEKSDRIGVPLAEIIRRKLEEWLREPDSYIIRKQ